MQDKKNVIFIPPLSQDLTELYKLYSEGDDKDLYEILSVEDLNEANQLIPSLGPALILTSAAKTCALMLRANKDYIKNFSSRVILVTPQVIPDKTINKLMKVGLSDYVKCPVNQKSLQYKCQLLLKSIPGTQVEEDKQEDDNSFVLESSKFDQGSIDTDKKQRLEKGIIEEEEKGQINKSDIEDINLNLIDNTMGNEKYRGSMDLKLDFDGPEEKENAPEKERLNNESEFVKERREIELQLEKESKELQDEQYDDQDDQKNKRREQLDIEAATKNSSKKESSGNDNDDSINKREHTEISVDDSNQNKEQSEDNAHNEEGDKKKANEMHLDIYDDGKSKNKKRHSSENEDDYSKSKKSHQLDIQEDQEDKSRTESEAEDDISHAKNSLKKEFEEQEDARAANLVLEISKEKENQEAGTASTLSKSEKDKSTKEQDNNNSENSKKDNHDLKLDYTKNNKKKQGDQSSEEDKHTVKSSMSTERATKKEKKEAVTLHITKDAQVGNKSESSHDNDKKKKKDIGLSLDSDKESSETENPSDDTELKKKKKEVTIDIHKSDEGFTEKIDLDIMKGKSKVEHIDNKFKTRKHHGELKIDFEKKNRGEGDTLDYSQIKKEYKELSQKLKGLSDEELTALRKKREDKLYSKKQVFEPHSKGIEEVIKLFTLYENKAKENDDIIFSLDRILYEKFGTKLAIFLYSKEKECFVERFQSFEIDSEDPIGKEQQWETIKLVNIDKWSDTEAIEWRDEHFEEDTNEFLFPFFQDNVKHGFAVLSFDRNIEKNKAFLVEVYLESIRGIIIEEYEEEMGNGITVVQHSDSNTETKQIKEKIKKEKKRGILSRFFG